MTFSNNFKLRGRVIFFFSNFFRADFIVEEERFHLYRGSEKLKIFERLKKKKEKVLGVDGVSSFIYFVNILLKADYI